MHHTSLPLRGVSPAINNECPSRRARLDTIGRVPLPFFENLRMSNGPARSRFVVRPISGREIGTACPSRLERIDVLDADLKYGSAGGPDVGKPTMRAAVSMPTGPWPCRPPRVRVGCRFCKGISESCRHCSTPAANFDCAQNVVPACFLSHTSASPGRMSGWLRTKVSSPPRCPEKPLRLNCCD